MLREQQMGNNRKLQFAIRAALAATAATAVVPVALAQTATTTTAPAPDTTLQEVVVTGSRIQSLNIQSISPISSVSAVDIQATGLTRVEDILNNLPMVFAGQNSTVSNGSDGTATVDLRGLGAKRTLTLVDGRRLGPGAGDGRNFSDINQIPTALIERVDILTGGASSVYGADAVSGVVNFVLNTHFQGIKIDASYNYNQHSQHQGVAEAAVNAAGDASPANSVNTGFGKNVSVLMGSNFDDNRGNATFYATFDTVAPILEGKYDYGACTLDATKAGGLKCGGSGTSAKNRAGGYFLASSAGAAGFTNTVDGLTGQFRPFTANDLYNFGPVNFYQRPNERWTAGSFVNYDVNSHVNVYAETMFTRNTSTAQIAASGDFFNNSFIPCNDPLLTAQEAAAICAAGAAQGASQVIGGVVTPGANLYIGRRNAEGGGRVASFQSDANRVVIGVKGDFADAWKYDVYAQHGTVDSANQNLNYFSNANIQNALTVVPGPGGVPTCASVVNGTDPKCVPWNIWVPGGVTAAATNYLSIPLLVDATTTEEIVSGSVTGDLGKYGLKIPMADEGLKVSLGAEWRSESAVFSPDLQSQLGNAAGSGGPTLPVAGEFTVKEVFTEFGIPIASHLPGADSLGIDLGYRYSDYSEGFKTNTYKGGVEWAPIHDARFRATYARAVRAPNITELFTPQSVGLDGNTDPCTGANVTPGPVTPASKLANGNTFAQCSAMGVTTAQFGHVAANPAQQYNGQFSGNAGLQPEKSDTYSVGIVLQPRFIENFTTSVDWFEIKVNDTVGPVGADVILGNCLNGVAAACNAVHRDAGGTLWRSPNGFVQDPNINFGSLSTKGIDVKMNYRTPIPAAGSMSFSLEGTRLIDLQTQPLTGGPSYNCSALFGAICGAPSPSWRHVFNTTWSTPWDGLDVTLRWRYLGKADSELTSTDPQLTGKALPQTSHIPAYNYIDLTARFNLYKSISLQLGVNNVTDKDPPLIDSGGGGFGSNCPAISSGPTASSCNGNTFPGTYDALGRFFFAHLTAQF
jgi:iron complex outermembrane receptor protein